MRINDIIVEQQLEEGPLGAIARGAGKVIGGIAKGVGAIAGIGAGAKKAFQKGKQASVDVIGGTGQGADAPAPAVAPAQGATAAPAPAAAAPAGGGAAQPATQGGAPAAQPAAQGGAPAAQPAAQGGAAQPAAAPAQGGGAPAAQGGAQQKIEPTMQKQPAAGGGDVADVIKQVDALQPAEKQQVLTAIQKAPAKEQPTDDANATPKPTAQPAAQPAAQGGAPAAQPAAQGGNFDAQTGKPTSQTGQNLETQIQDAKQQAAQKAGRGLSPQEEKDVEAQIRGTMKPKAAPPADDNPNIVRGTESVKRRGKMVREYTEEFILYKPQTVRTTLRESRKPKQKFSIYKS